MFDQRTLVIALATLAGSVAIGGALLGSGPQTASGFSTYPGVMRMAQSQVEPQLSQAKKDFMNFTMPDLSQPQELRAETEPLSDPIAESSPSEAERGFMDLTMPDLSQPQSGGETTRHGCVKPDRPQWAVDIPREDAYKVLLLTGLYNAARFEKIIETNDCPCNVEHPSWDEADRQYQQIASGKDRWEILKLRREASRRSGEARMAALTICDQARGN